MPRYLETYLQDHHAGSTAGVAAFTRVAAHHGDEQVRRRVAALAAEVQADQDALDRLMDRLGVAPSAVKEAGGWLAEKLSRLKPNDHVVSRSPLSDVLELELLVDAVNAKGLMWKGLLQLDDPRFDHEELRRLADRADAQRDELEQLRLSHMNLLAD